MSGKASPFRKAQKPPAATPPKGGVASYDFEELPEGHSPSAHRRAKPEESSHGLAETKTLKEKLRDPHLSIDLCKRLTRDGACFLGTGFQDSVEGGIVVLVYPFLKRTQKFDDGFGELGLEMAVAFSFEMPFAFLIGSIGEEVVDRQQV